MYSDIIIGFDGSVASRGAVALGRRLARATGARPTVIYVRSPKPVTDEIPEVPDDDTWGPSVATTLDEARALLADVPTATFRGVAETSVAQVLDWAAEAADAALIVLGATHRSGAGLVIPGTTADAVLHAAPCAVAIAPLRFAETTPPQPFGVVAAAVDGGGESERVAHVAARIARGAGSALRLGTVTRPGDPGYASLDLVVRESAPALLDRLARGAGPGLDIELRADVGNVEDGVRRIADGVDLLVIGSRGYGPLRRVLHGSATTKILQAVACPVIVVPRRTAERGDDAVVPLAATVAAGPGTGGRTHHHGGAR